MTRASVSTASARPLPRCTRCRSGSDGPLDQHHRQAELPRGVELGPRPRAAARSWPRPASIRCCAHQRQIARHGERPARHDGHRHRAAAAALPADRPAAADSDAAASRRKRRDAAGRSPETPARAPSGSAATAPAMSATCCPAIARPGLPGRRSSAISGTPASRAGGHRVALIWAAKGWVASTTWVIASSASR